MKGSRSSLLLVSVNTLLDDIITNLVQSQIVDSANQISSSRLHLIFESQSALFISVVFVKPPPPPPST